MAGSKKKRPEVWYQNLIERVSRHAVDQMKKTMLVVFDRKKIIFSFNDMFRIIGGNRNRCLLAWQELRESGEIVESQSGWCRSGMQKYVIDRADNGFLAGKLAQDIGDGRSWGEVFRQRWLEEQNPELKEARLAMEALKRKHAPMNAMIEEARRVLDEAKKRAKGDNESGSLPNP